MLGKFAALSGSPTSTARAPVDATPATIASKSASQLAYGVMAEARPVLASHALFDLPDQCVGVAADPGEDPTGLVAPAMRDEKARRFGDVAVEEQDHGAGRQVQQPQHPPAELRDEQRGRAGGGEIPRRGADTAERDQQPAAMRRLREAFKISGSRRSLRVIELIMASDCLKFFSISFGSI
jgi:hypothetical protein